LIRFYFHPTPNPLKVALFLEEAGIAYEVVPVDTRKGEQHTFEFRLSTRTENCPQSSIPTVPAVRA